MGIGDAANEYFTLVRMIRILGVDVVGMQFVQRAFDIRTSPKLTTLLARYDRFNVHEYTSLNSFIWEVANHPPIQHVMLTPLSI